VDFLNHVLTKDIRRLAPGEGQYTLMCNERGGVIDDLYAYRLSGEVFLLIIDASRNYAAVAVQGPRVKEFINACVPGASSSAMRVNAVTDLKKNQIGGFKFENHSVLVSRTGYTGEDGFEIVDSDAAIQHIWDKILAVGQPFGIKPCGLGARDTLQGLMPN